VLFFLRATFTIFSVIALISSPGSVDKISPAPRRALCCNCCLTGSYPAVALVACLLCSVQRRFQGVPDWVCYCGPVRSVNQQIGNAVPYPMVIEVAASVFEAATGLNGRRPPPLVGPSLEGWGLPEAQRQRYDTWLKDTGWQGVVEGSRAALQAELSYSTCPDAPSQTAAAAGAASGGSGSKQQQALESSGGGSMQRRRHRQQQQQQAGQKSGLQPSTDEELGDHSSQQTKGLTPSKRHQPDEQ